MAGRLPDLLSAFIAALNEGVLAHRRTHARHRVALHIYCIVTFTPAAVFLYVLCVCLYLFLFFILALNEGGCSEADPRPSQNYCAPHWRKKQKAKILQADLFPVPKSLVLKMTLN